MNIKSFIKDKRRLRDDFYRKVDSEPEQEIANLLIYNGVPNKKPTNAFLGQYYRKLWDSCLTEDLKLKLQKMRRNIINNSKENWSDFWWYWIDVHKEEYRKRGIGLHTIRRLKQNTFWKNIEKKEPQKKLNKYP